MTDFWSDNSADTPIAGSYINKYYYAALAAIGITEEEKRKERNIDFHSLRHFFNSMLRGEIDDNNLRLIVGHQSERMSDNYTHEVRERLLQIGKVSSNIIDAECMYIVSGDDDLLSLGNIDDLNICTPAEFLNAMKRAENL